MSIPVISAAIVNEPYWLYRLIASIDYPTDNLVIINNNGRGEINQELDNMTKITHKFIKKITVCHMPANIGLAGSWNLTIKCYMLSPYWIFVNHDISFSLGLLKELAETAENDKDAGMVFGHGGDFGDGSYDVMLIKDWAWLIVSLMAALLAAMLSSISFSTPSKAFSVKPNIVVAFALFVDINCSGVSMGFSVCVKNLTFLRPMLRCSMYLV